MDLKPCTAVADVLDAQRLVWADTVHNPGWAVPTAGGGAVVQPGSTDVHVETFDRLWIRDRAGRRETHIDLPPGALPARAGHALATVSMAGEVAALANLATGGRHHVAERAPVLDRRLAKWPVLAALAGLLAAAGLAGSDPARSAARTPAEVARLPRTVCDIGPGELCDRYNADLRARAPVWGGGRWAAATGEAFRWAANRDRRRGLDGLSPPEKLDRALEAPQFARLSAAEREEWRRAMEAQWRLISPEGPYERALRRARGEDWLSRAPRAVFLILVAGGPASLILFAVRNAIADARRRDEAVDAALDAALAGGRAAEGVPRSPAGGSGAARAVTRRAADAVS